MKQKLLKAVESVKKNQISYLIKIVLTLLVIFVFLLIFFLFDGLSYFRYPSIVTSASESDLEVHFIDVGQGDSTLIRFPNNKIMLVDTGESFASESLINYIDQFMTLSNHYVIDYLILTHPDSDHVGGTKNIIENFETQLVFRPKVLSRSESEQNQNSNYITFETDTYENAISSLYEKSVKMIYSESGISFNEAGAQIDFLSPTEDFYSDSNNYSAVVKISYNDKSFLFTGDCENLIENQLLQNGAEIDIDVLKVSHHGSNTATSKQFLSVTTPIYACISVGNNNYNLPNSEVISRIKESGAQILMTKDLGSFAIAVNDKALEVYYLNENTIDFTIIILVAGVFIVLIWGLKLPKGNS